LSVKPLYGTASHDMILPTWGVEGNAAMHDRRLMKKPQLALISSLRSLDGSRASHTAGD
jgi:hypothetical protein